jgi:hypothetical protein
MIRPFPRPPRYLGTYTVAQWGPIGPRRGDVATLADTYDSVTICWEFEYDPAGNSTYPWKAVTDQGWAGVTEKGVLGDGTTVGTNSMSVTGAWQDITIGGSTSRTRFRVPRGGQWHAWWRARDFSSSGNVGFVVGVAVNSSTPPDSLSWTYADRTYENTVLRTCAAGDYLQMRHNNTTGSNGSLHALTFAVRPVRIS